MNRQIHSAPCLPGVIGRGDGVCIAHKIVIVALIAAVFCVSGSAQTSRQVQRTPGQSPQTLQQGSQQPAPPVFTSFSPTQGAAGSTVTITFNGANFVARVMNLTFSPSQGISVSGLKVTTSAQITAQVQIAANAQQGSRQVFLVDGDHDLRIATPFMITAAAPNNCPPGMLTPAGCGTTQTAAPALRGFTPVQGTQGTTVALIFSGINFISPAALQFTPNSGITVLSATVTNGNEIQAQISIAPNASLGSRNVIVTVGGQTRLTASNTFTVMSGAPTARVAPFPTKLPQAARMWT